MIMFFSCNKWVYIQKGIHSRSNIIGLSANIILVLSNIFVCDFLSIYIGVLRHYSWRKQTSVKYGVLDIRRRPNFETIESRTRESTRVSKLTSNVRDAVCI